MSHSRTCLLIVDVQVGFFGLPRPLFGAPGLLEVVGSLLARARSGGNPIVYVQHTGSDAGPFARGTSGWHIHRDVAPLAGEHIVEKQHCDAFNGNDLEGTLKRLGVDRIVVCGLVTEGCIDTTIRRAFSLGFKVEVASDGHSTTDSNVLTAEQIVRHHNEVFRIFGNVRPAEGITFEEQEV